MANINILDYEILSSFGDLKQTLDMIKKGDINISQKTVFIDEVSSEIPFFAFKKNIELDHDSIKKVFKNLLSKIINKIDEDKRSNTALIIGLAMVDCNLVDIINESIKTTDKISYLSHKYSIDSLAKELSKEFGLNEFTMSINTACTSSANALLEASNLINCGVVDYAVVAGLEIFSPIMSSGFYSMQLLSSTYPKPFDKKRDGIVLGEAMGVMLLGKDDSKWSLLGGFSNCNSETITSVSQNGDECVEVIKKALKNSKVEAKDITALKAHATGSQSNDLAEINAISKVFDSSLIFTALKPYVGHTIGASGVLEISLFMGAIDDGFIPKTLSCKEPELNNYLPLNENKKCKNGIFMCNYFGFGGNNTSLIIKKEV